MPITLPKGSLIKVNGVELSEHNRSAPQISFEPVKYDVRLASGTMRRYVVGNKRILSISWEMLPALDSQTVDGKAGRNTLKSLVEMNMGDTVTISYKEVNATNDQTEVSFTAFIDSYSESLMKRFDAQYWNVEVSFVEV